MKKELKLDDYISIAKLDIKTYIIATVMIFGVLLFIGYKVDFYYILFFDLIMILRVIERIDTYNNLRLIKSYLVEKNLINKLDKIDFWNERNYFLTTNYLIIVKNKKVYLISYNEILRIYTETVLRLNKHGGYQEYLHIFTSGDEFKILTFSTYLVGDELIALKSYILKKNNKIIIEENRKG